MGSVVPWRRILPACTDGLKVYFLVVFAKKWSLFKYLELPFMPHTTSTEHTTHCSQTCVFDMRMPSMTWIPCFMFSAYQNLQCLLVSLNTPQICLCFGFVSLLGKQPDFFFFIINTVDLSIETVNKLVIVLAMNTV